MQAAFGQLRTEEANDRYSDLDVFSIPEIIQLMNEADKSVAVTVENALGSIAKAVELIVPKLQAGGRMIYVGAGTSGRLGVLDAAECPPTFNTSPDLVMGLIAGGKNAMFEAVEQAEDHASLAAKDLATVDLTGRDVVVGIAASGRTPYVMGGLIYAHSVGAGTVSLSCNANSEISAIADMAIELDTGPEVLMGSTRLKAATAQKMVLNMLSTTTMIRLGKVYRNLMVDLRATNEKLVERSKRIIMLATDVDYEAAAAVLSAADGQVKTAIVMLKLGVSKHEAQRRIENANGFLRQALKTAGQ